MELLAILKGWGLAPALIVISILLLFSLIMFFLSWKTGKSFQLSIGPFKLALGGKKQEEDTKESDKEQENKDDYAISVIQEKLEKIHEIRHKDTLERQLKFADEKIIEMKSLLTNRFAKLLQEKLKDDEDAKLHRDYRFYQTVISFILNYVRETTLKSSLVQNHFINYTEIEWEDYISQKADVMITIGCDNIEVLYEGSSKTLSSKELEEGNQDIIPTVREMIKNIFRKAKYIALENNKKIEAIETEIENEKKRLSDN